MLKIDSSLAVCKLLVSSCLEYGPCGGQLLVAYDVYGKRIAFRPLRGLDVYPSLPGPGPAQLRPHGPFFTLSHFPRFRCAKAGLFQCRAALVPRQA